MRGMKQIIAASFAAFLALACPASAAVTIDAVSGSFAAGVGVTTLSIPLTVGTVSNGALAVELVFETSAVPTILTSTWNITGTLVVVTGTTSTNGANSSSSVIYCMAAPASGAHNAVFTWTGAANAYGVAISVAGADQTTPCQNGNNAISAIAVASPVTVTVTSAVGDIAFAVEVQPSSLWGAISGTTIATDTSGPTQGTAANYAPGAATVTLTAAYTGTSLWSASGADFKAAAGGASPPPMRTMIGVGK